MTGSTRADDTGTETETENAIETAFAPRIGGA